MTIFETGCKVTKNFAYMQDFPKNYSKLSHKTVYSARKGANQTLYFQEHEVGGDIAVGQFRFHDKQVDMETIFGFLQFLQQCLLTRGKVIQQTD